MSEYEIIEKTINPITQTSIIENLRLMGVKEGDILLVHSSLSNMGWVCGGANAVIDALLQSVGKKGTIVMPAHTSNITDPEKWCNPPVPNHWLDTIYQEMLLFDKVKTQSYGMGTIAELFRNYPNTYRSNHPQVSFTANGIQAKNITSKHDIAPQFGKDSPLGYLYNTNAKVLLLGVSYDVSSCFHLSEVLSEEVKIKKNGILLNDNGLRNWQWIDDYDYDSDDFIKIGRDYELNGKVVCVKIGNADCRLFSLKEGVNFGVEWIKRNRINKANL